MKTTNQTQNDSRNRISTLSARCHQWSKFAAASLVLVACVLCAVPLRAQTATFRSPQLRVTVPLNYSGTFLLVSNVLTVRTNGAAIAPDGTGSNWFIGPLNFDVSGAPSGVTAAVVDQTLTPVTTWTPHLNTNSTSTSSNLLVLLTFSGTEAEGLSTLSFNVTGGVTNNIFLEVQVGSFWTGDTNVTTAWSSTASWVSGVLPTNVNDVLFTQLGAQTNFLVNGVSPFTNSIVDQNFTIASLRFLQTNSGVRYHALQVNPGVTLAVAGSNGFSIMKDYLNGLYPAGAGVGAVGAIFTGIGGRLVVTNELGNFLVLVDNNAVSAANGVSLDMMGLGTFVADVNSFSLGDVTFWPNFRNLNDLNAYNGQPRSCNGNINLARTNVIKAIYADPFNYTNADRRRFGFNYLNCEVSGSTTVETLNLGISNIFFLDSINFGGGNARANALFNPGLLRDTNIVVGVSTNFFTNTLTAIFRGTNGGRMSVFSISDGAGTNTSSSSPNNNISFAGGTVDILADRFYIGRDRKTIPIGQNPSYVGNFFMTKGIVDANTAILGFREYNQTNALLGQVSLGYCVGRITVSNTAVFKVNQLITLGSTVATNANEESSGGNVDQGGITVASGGTMIANAIYVGGPIYGVSRNNNVIVTNSSMIIISNTVASANQYLDQFSLANGSTLQMSIDGTHSGAYMFTTNLTFSTTTTNNILRLATIKNLSSYPATVPLIFHVSATAGSLPVVAFPSGFTGSLSDNGAGNTIDLIVATNVAKRLVWRGVDANWDLTSKNWLDQSTLVMTNFDNFDVVAFDDAAGYPTNIAIADLVLPTAVNMTNATTHYTFANGGGQLSGSGLLTKTGSGTLEVEVASTITYAINQGTLTNGTFGSLGSVIIGAGAVLANAGTINNGIDCSGLATISSGTVNGPVAVESGGVVTNLSTIQGGAFTVQDGGFLYNGTNAILDNFGSSTVVSNATLINDGILGTEVGGFIQSLTVNGTLKDSGASGLPSMSLQTLTINQGAVFIPGGDDLGTSSIRNPLNGNTNGPPGRVVLSSGSTNIFKVNAGTLASSRLLSAYQDFGPSQSSQLQNGCTLVITNVSGTPFAAGQYFRLFGIFSTGGNPVPTGTATNSFPVIVPAKPGPGLIWDLTRLWGNNGSGNWGYIGVAVPGIVHLTNSFVSAGDGTNIVGQFSWPATNYGWRLQTLVTPKEVGLVASTNWDWTGVAGSWTNLSMTFSNKLSTTNTVFYRLVYP